MSIRESALSLISSISQSDYLRAVTSGGNSRRVTMANAAKAVVEGYSGSSLGGSQRTVKAAIDAMANYSDIIDKIAIKNTASGPVASFPDGSDGLPFQSLIADINPVQSGSGTPSPQNIRPISGHTQVKTTRAGKNLVENTLSSSTLNGVTWTKNADGTITANNTATANSTRSFVFNIPSGNYYFNGCPSGGSNTKYDVYIWDNTANARAKQWDGTTAVVSDFGSNNNNQVQILSGHNYTYNCRVMSGYNAQNIVFKPMIRPASFTDGTFEPYNGNTYTTALGRTVYGGTLDVVSGVLTVTHKYNSETAQFTGASSYNTDATHKNAIFWYACSDSAVATDTNAKYGIVCSGLEEITFNQALSTSAEYYGVYLNNSANTTMLRVTIPKSLGITTLAQANSWLTSIGGLQIAYPLATPQTYQLTAQQIQTLLGTNNVWADSGDVDVVYIADTKLYIDNH